MTTDKIKFLEDLCNCYSPSGFEIEALRIWKKYLNKNGIEVETDSYGNSVAVIGPKDAPTTMGIVGHADEIGQMVTHIDDRGFLNISAIGGWDTRILLGRNVKVLTSNGHLDGIIGSTAIHIIGKDGAQKAPSWEELYVDIYAKDKKDAEKKVRVGDPVVIDQKLRVANKDFVTGKALDNKIGIWSSAETLVRLKSRAKNLKVRVAGFCSVQEEIGLAGAGMIAKNYKPDMAIAIDVSHSTDHPGIDKRKSGSCMSTKGPVIGRGSANHPLMVEQIAKVAARTKIKIQFDTCPIRTGTDGDALYAAGIPCMVMSLPIRYMHTPVETAYLKDLDNIPNLLCAYALSLPKSPDFRPKF